MRVLLTAFLLLAAAPAYADPAVTLFDVPGAKETIPRDVNASGSVVGEARIKADPDCRRSCGFLRAADGSLTLFSVPEAKATTALTVDGLGKNTSTISAYMGPSGTIAGQCFTSAKSDHGYLRMP